MSSSPPEIVCGPIVRRCSADMITVWIATSIDVGAGGALAIYDVGKAGTEVLLGSVTEHRSVRVGVNLFINLLIARPAAAGDDHVRDPKFPTGRMLAYELSFELQRLPGRDPEMVTLDAMIPGVTLAYPPYRLPTLFIQADKTPLKIIQGSCRRPYADGADAMAAFDTLLGAAATDPADRPSALLLTGDQIYADDIVYAMLELTSSLAVQLAGYDETLPVDGKPVRITSLGNRRDLVLKKAAFTTEDGGWHLLGFSEYCAHYLLSWCEALWTGFKPTLSGRGINDLNGVGNVMSFQETLPAVRRALANISTYMIFDDHDVTDDWNLDKDWVDGVAASPTGTRVVTSALISYWLFQGWGNDPVQFDAKFIARVQGYCDLFTKAGGDVKPEATADHDSFVRQDIGVSGGFGRKPSWHYVLPTKPPVFVLDTRTARDLHPRGLGPGLLNSAARRDLDDAIAAEVKRNALDLKKSPLILVSATPIYAMEFVEVLQKLEISQHSNHAEMDFEFWRDNPRAQMDFLRDLARRNGPRRILVLSGDVHYGYTAKVKLFDGGIDPHAEVKGKPDRASLLVDIVQMTSSALKNESGKTKQARWLVSRPVLSIVKGVKVDRSWTHYIFDRRSHVSYKGNPIETLWLTLPLAEQNHIWGLNLYMSKTDHLFVPKRYFKGAGADLKVTTRAAYREEGRYYDHSGSAGAPLTAIAHFGVVVVDGLTVTHSLYGAKPNRHVVKQAPLSPAIWGPESVRLPI
jgi:hypothetical protein